MNVRLILRDAVVVVLFLAAGLCPPSASGQDVRLRISPELAVPLIDTDTFGAGPGASLTFETNLFGFFSTYAGAAFHRIPLTASEFTNPLFMTSAGGGIGFFGFPFPRLKLAASAGGGVYVGSYSNGETDLMTGNVFWKTGAEAGFRFRPGFTLSAGASYVDYRTETTSFLRGLNISLAADIGFRSRTVEGRVTLQSAESHPVFPISAADYRTSEFGTVKIRNAESAEIRNVEVWFFVDGYSSGPILCARFPFLPRGATVTAPLFADFSERVLTVTETVRVSGEVRVVYELLGESRSSSSDTTITVLHRNALTWDDPRILAAFVSANDPAVLDASKFIAGVVRSETRAELDSNLQYGLGVFEGLRLAGVAWAPDPQTPYAATRRSGDSIDYVQYPHQTLAYRGGDSDDIAVLYAAALESVGVPAALIALEDEVLVAFKLSSPEASARATFSNHDEFLFIDGETWVPVRVTMLREGFLRAWNEGAALATRSDHTNGSFFALTDAWQRHPPVGVPGVSAVTQRAPEAQIRTAFRNVVSLVVTREVGPRAESMRASFGPDGGTGRQRNALGVLYARYGMYQEALMEFQAATDRSYRRAATNIGNVAFLLRDFETALAWYENALRDTPDEPASLIGLARSLYELDRYDEADAIFNRVTNVRPELADRYGYLSARLPGSEVRASAAMDRIGDMMWDD